MWKNTRNVFYKTRAVRNTYSKGNIDHSNSALAETDKVCSVTPPKTLQFPYMSEYFAVKHRSSLRKVSY